MQGRKQNQTKNKKKRKKVKCSNPLSVLVRESPAFCGLWSRVIVGLSGRFGPLSPPAWASK